MSDGPQFLSTPPASLPDPDHKPTVVPPPSPPPYRTAGVVARPEPRVPPPPPRTEPARKVPEPIEDVEPIGDRTGEHRYMTRGRYGAWLHVILAFALETVILGWVPAQILHALLDRLARNPDIAMYAGYGSGAVLAYLVFRDRWRCIEAFASRFCSGVANLSVLYVPAIAVGYANVRAINKLRGR